jgi:hypothetical protein
MKSKTGALKGAALFTAFVTLAALQTACSDTGPKAALVNFTDTLTTYAVNGTPLGSPSGLWFFFRRGVPVDKNFTFDVAFDIDKSTGEARVFPQALIAGGLVPPLVRSVGIKRSTANFDDLLRADNSGYTFDSTFVAHSGDVFLVQSNDASACNSLSFGTVIYTKLQVLEVNPASRTISSRFTVNPNCGFLSLIPEGTPKN